MAVPRGTFIGNNRVLVHLATGGHLVVRADDLSILPELLRDGMYDVPFTRFLQRVLRPDDVFVDIGANVGLFTIIGGFQAWRGRTIAYEAAPPMLEVLQDNVAMNWFSDRVTVRGVAVGAEAGRARFGFPVRQHGLGGLGVTAATLRAGDPRAEVQEFDVEVVRLDDDLAELGQPIRLVKIDVEGGEASVLDGMRGLLEGGRIDALSMEIRRDLHGRDHGSSWPAVVAHLEWFADHGWTFSELDPLGAERTMPPDEVVERGLFSNLVIRRSGAPT